MKNKSFKPVTGERLTWRRLPHFQQGGRTYHVTFSVRTGTMSDPVRELVLKSCLFWNEKRCIIHACVVMPDHVHILMTPNSVEESQGFHSLSQLLHSIKSYSAKQINRILNRKGPYWETESFDRYIRNENDFEEKYNYIRDNPQKAGLAAQVGAYPYMYLQYGAGFEQNSKITQSESGSKHRRDACSTSGVGGTGFQPVPTEQDACIAPDAGNRRDACPTLIRALNGEPVDRPPVWAMRQAGRWDPEFLKLRGDLSFYEFSENAELAAQASLLPERFGVDAIILFYDITTVPIAMGMDFELVPGRGPVPDKPISSMADVDRLDARPDPERFQHILDLIRIVKSELAGRLPILIFAGAPYTVGSYCIGTGKNRDVTLNRINELTPTVWNRFNDKLIEATVRFLKVLAAEGAAAYQLFDSWAGDLSPRHYAEYAHQFHQTIFNEVDEIPSILFVNESPPEYLDLMMNSGANVLSLGTSIDLRTTRQKYPGTILQGNVDQQLLRNGTPVQVLDATRNCIEATKGQHHIVNLSHGVDKNTPVENFMAFIQAVKTWSPQPPAPNP